MHASLQECSPGNGNAAIVWKHSFQKNHENEKLQSFCDASQADFVTAFC